MKRYLMAFALTGLLAGSVMAGDISTSGSPAPAPVGTTQTTDSTSPGEIPTDGVPGQISGGALSALLSVLGLLV